MIRICSLALTASLLTAATATADVVMLDAVQVGGFYAGGATPDNLPTFQNYFVGYGTSPGGSRTPERRSFFHFSLGGVSGVIHSATLTLKLVMPGGLVFGKGPGDPAAPPVPSDMMEVFQLGTTPFPSPLVTMPGLPPATSAAIFGSFATMPIAAPLEFVMGGPPPADPIVIPLDSAGLGLLTTAAGGDVVLTGWMPTWSEDTRIAPGSMPPIFFEGSELIFGFTDVHAGFAKPVLTIDFTPIPEAGAGLLLGAVALSALAVSWLRP